MLSKLAAEVAVMAVPLVAGEVACWQLFRREDKVASNVGFIAEKGPRALKSALA
jgi:hypothetical protein